eukprot:6192256-Pleurochrysis_carterae.AAC.1
MRDIDEALAEQRDEWKRSVELFNEQWIRPWRAPYSDANGSNGLVAFGAARRARTQRLRAHARAHVHAHALAYARARAPRTRTCACVYAHTRVRFRSYRRT